MFNSRFSDPRLLVAALAVLGLVAVGPSCSKSDGGNDDDHQQQGVEVCDNGADDDADGFVDCEDGDCAETPHCCPDCGKQCHDAGQAACQTSYSRVTMVCSPDGDCEPSGLVNEDGTTRIGWSAVMSKMAEINPTLNYAAEQLLVLSSDRPNTTEKATCAAIMAREIDPTNPNDVNAVLVANFSVVIDGQKPDYVPAQAWPVPLPKEGQTLLAIVRFYMSQDHEGNPRGDIVGEGCTEVDTIHEGDPEVGHETDPDYQWEVDIRLFCGGFLNRSCPDPKTCINGLCRDTRCAESGETCGPGYTCREWDGVPDCRKTCNPDDPDCPNLNYCDATPGEPAVCVPAQ
jgi:hypothetical protein